MQRTTSHFTSSDLLLVGRKHASPDSFRAAVTDAHDLTDCCGGNSHCQHTDDN